MHVSVPRYVPPIIKTKMVLELSLCHLECEVTSSDRMLAAQPCYSTPL